jgi:hypothetical protein
VRITSPANGSMVGRRSTITVTATATDNVGVKEVRFNLNGALRCISSASTLYQCQITLPNAKRWTGLIDVQASDAAGNVGRSSVSVTTQ